ncbi:MAG: ABC transporter [Clostridiales bacterium]|nr:MAG: ABC transporter [Clostridiales bacterium]HJA32031.1 ATP-binding cassette domain-containing protein [Candidatus Eisenbergiella pullicola]
MEPMIRIENVSKTFRGKENTVEALKGITLEIGAGDIYGIIGMSGAGKSTLVRCLNFLERPTEGTVYVEGKDLSAMSEKELRRMRTRVAMIFQHFNLLMQRTVLDNVCFPMEIAGVPKKEAREKARRYLEIVELSDKEKAFPAQLSGGQKQRVAIARALAMDPKILLCDEATSALDPTTTRSILALLKEINRKYGITIVIITHSMEVVQEICTRVAIIDAGVLAESGTVEEVFASPKSRAAKRLVFQGERKVSLMKSKRCIRIVFTENSSFEPVIANMVLECRASVNILLADTKDIGGIARGQMVLQLPEDEQTAEKMIAYLKERNLAVEELTDYVE